QPFEQHAVFGRKLACLAKSHNVILEKESAALLHFPIERLFELSQVMKRQAEAPIERDGWVLLDQHQYMQLPGCDERLHLARIARDVFVEGVYQFLMRRNAEAILQGFGDRMILREIEEGADVGAHVDRDRKQKLALKHLAQILSRDRAMPPAIFLGVQDL